MYFWKTEKISLRRFKEEDAKYLYETQFDSNDQRVYEPGIQTPKSIEAYEKYVETLKDKQYMYIVEDRNLSPVGSVGISYTNERSGHFGVFVQVFRDHRGRGYAKDALFLILKFAFLELRMNKVNSETIIINEGSIALHKSLGFKEEGIRRENVFTAGRYYDEILFGMTRKDFEIKYKN